MNAIAQTQLTEAEIDAIRAEAKRTIAEHFQTQAAAARDSGVAESTFAAFMADTYTGDNAKVAAKVATWMKSRADRAKTVAILPKAPPFQLTPTARKIQPLLQFAQAVPDFVVCIGGPGIGKTKTAEAYRDSNPNVWLATMDPTTAGVNPMLRELCRSMDLAERNNSELSRAIGTRIKSCNQGLIIVDEAQFLSAPALEQLRSLHDRYKVGIALVGNQTVHARLYGDGKVSHAQLFSRVGMRVRQTKPQAGDVCLLLDAWGIEDKEQRRFLKEVANKNSALRGMVKCITAATLLAAGANEPLSLRHLRDAWETLDVNLSDAA